MAQVFVVVLAIIAFLYFARPVVLPLVLALMAASTLKPVMRLFARIHIPTIPAALIILAVLVACVVVGFVQAGRPAVAWVDEAPRHMEELRVKVARLFPALSRMSHAMDAMNSLSVTGDKADGQKKIPTVEIKDPRDTSTLLSWTETFVAGLGEVIVLVYLLLASGDMFLKKLVRVIPRDRDKKRAIEITHEVQQQISNYLFSVSLINIGLGAAACAGFYLIGVPRALMWGAVVAILNFIPYFGPVVGVCALCVVGLLSFDSLSQAFMPFGWYLLLHLLEANFVTPILLGRRFTLNPVAIFVSLMFWLWLWGLPGALLSVPILMALKATCDRMPGAKLVSEFISR